MKKVLFIVFALVIAVFAAGCAKEHDGASDITTDGVTSGTESAAPTDTEDLTEAVSETEETGRFEPDLSKPLTAEGVRIHTLKCPESDYVTAQGCCFDGENWVVAFNKFDKNGEECTLLCKFDTDGKLVKTSDGPLYLEHANNITYLPDEKAYYVTSCQGTVRECWNGYSIVDRDSLEVLEKGRLEQPFFAMSYCPERDAYASGRWAGETLDFWDGERNAVAGRICRAG